MNEDHIINWLWLLLREYLGREVLYQVLKVNVEAEVRDSKDDFKPHSPFVHSVHLKFKLNNSRLKNLFRSDYNHS